MTVTIYLVCRFCFAHFSSHCLVDHWKVRIPFVLFFACVSSLQLGDNGQAQVLESPPGPLLCTESFDSSMEGC